ncbi:cupin domain-containing protein [Candidatus Poribacteria bacterium]|nr:cupin domain-containing protein [Candidatus Poribacteria bacterium]
MKVRSYDPDALRPAHENTILAHGVFGGDEIGAPFSCAIGLLRTGMEQKPERASVSKIYYVRFGEGAMEIDGERRVIREGDVVFIPAGSLHTVRNECEADFSTFAVWWTPKES